MRKITQEAVNPLIKGEKFFRANTRVTNSGEFSTMRLHGNIIAHCFHNLNGAITITNAGWFSHTTKERLNGLPNVSISQKKGIWYLNGEKWDGEIIDIKNKNHAKSNININR